MGEEEFNDIRFANVSLILDDYSDLFSDFDPRNYSERALSADFLVECKNATRDKSEHGLELRLQVPKDKRNQEHEEIIKRRLKNHFQRHYVLAAKESKKEKVKGGFMIVLGTAFLVTATLIQEETFLMQFLITLLEPAGWFSMWEGLYMIVFMPEDKKLEYEFYKKMSNVHIEFSSY